MTDSTDTAPRTRPRPDAPAAADALWAQLRAVRQHTLALAAPLSAEDQCVQSMPDASPAKWHLAHTTWFFETLVLQPHLPGWRTHDARYAALFNSYYEALGARHPRPQRGLLTRPSLDEVLAYRAAVDAGLERLAADPVAGPAARAIAQLGLHHEQQHQELLLTDALHLLSLNPLAPALRSGPAPATGPAPAGWLERPGGAVEIGRPAPGTAGGAAADGAPDAFAFDNETPRYAVLLQPFALARRAVTNAEYAAFVADGGYRTASLWLSDGWAAVQQQGWAAPLHWRDDGLEFTVHGLQPLDPQAPVRHLSFFEAAAYAEWAGARLPTEAEWESAVVAAGAAPGPSDAPGASPLAHVFGAVWQWTRSSYDPYPRFRPLPGAVGEYNGKFMAGQFVLRGSSAFTPPGHARASYRNFFPPATRWQQAGLRLARDL